MVQAVARIYRPGCKADHALILEGPQGAFKSTACAVIAMSPDWFADEIADLGSKDSAQDLRGKWIIEIGELSCPAPLRGGARQGVHLALHRPLSTELWPPQPGLSREAAASSAPPTPTPTSPTRPAAGGSGRSRSARVDIDELRRDIG